MVVKMMKWSPWPPASAVAAKKFQVRVKQMKLEGFSDDGDGDNREKVMVIGMRWKGSPKTGLVPFHRPSSKHHRKHISNEMIVKKGEPIKWDDEFENVCDFPITSKGNTFGPWEASFTLLYGAKTEAKAKLAVVGKVSLDLAEMASKMDSMIETKLPINLQLAGVAREATLSVCLSFVEVRNSQDSPGIVQNSTESKNMEGDERGMGSVDDREGKDKQSPEAVSSDYTDESDVFDSEGTPENELGAPARLVHLSSATESGLGPSSETHESEPVKKAGLFSWKKRRLSFKPGKTKVEPLIKKSSDADVTGDGDEKEIDGDRHRQRQRRGSSSINSITTNLRPKLDATEPSCEQEGSSSTPGHWEEKELVSRDGQAKLKAKVFFASFDQRSDQAAGESACTALVAVIAHWLHSNQDNMPTRSEFDRLIVEGSSEWRKLSDNQDLVDLYPDKHFDLDTVLQAGLRPVSVLPEKSVVGCFGPEKFEHLKEAMSFDQIWDEINSNTEGNRPRIYIVSWNDHFFLLKVDANAYYIIDTLGERLFEGCNQAYILRFDDSAFMHGKVEREVVSSEAMSGTETTTKPEDASEEEEEEICSGKECCREFIKRFLAAIPLRELESEEKKEPVPYYTLLQRLQIEFNFSSSFSQSTELPLSSQMIV